MFVGHYAVSFYLKSREPRIPLWVLFLAVQLVDLIWGVLVLAGVEQLAMVPGITRASPLDLIFVPYTHSLVAVLGWSLLAFWLWRQFKGRSAGGVRAAGLVGLAVLSHWLADFLVHRPDLPLYDNAAKVGLGLWNYPAVSYSMEVGLLGFAMWLWYRASKGAAAGWALLTLWAFLAVAQAYTNFGSLPASPRRFVMLAMLSYVMFALASHASDAHSPPSAAA